MASAEGSVSAERAPTTSSRVSGSWFSSLLTTLTCRRRNAKKKGDIPSPRLVDRVRSLIYGYFFSADNPIATQWGYFELLKKLPNGASILDVGCGDGRNSEDH